MDEQDDGITAKQGLDSEHRLARDSQRLLRSVFALTKGCTARYSKPLSQHDGFLM